VLPPCPGCWAIPGRLAFLAIGRMVFIEPIHAVLVLWSELRLCFPHISHCSPRPRPRPLRDSDRLPPLPTAPGLQGCEARAEPVPNAGSGCKIHVSICCSCSAGGVGAYHVTSGIFVVLLTPSHAKVPTMPRISPYSYSSSAGFCGVILVDEPPPPVLEACFLRRISFSPNMVLLEALSRIRYHAAAVPKSNCSILQ